MTVPPDEASPTTFTITGTDHIDASDAVTLTMQDLRSRREEAGLEPGKHLWVAALIYVVEDPETALDDMTFGSHNLFGAQPIACFWCGEDYRKDRTGLLQMDEHCPGRPPQP